MFKKGDNVVLILKPNGNLEMKKEKTNFWDEVSKMSAKEKRLQIEDLGRRCQYASDVMECQ